MSASLVGSEMCIRDSPRTPGVSPPAFVRFRRAAAPLPFRCYLCLCPCLCLLYTSDAADDM
eukprot:3885311-Alexandrium_andersonii.AAC.1